MKNPFKLFTQSFFTCLMIFVVFVDHSTLQAQDSKLSKSYKDAVIQKASEELKARYVFPEKAESIANQLSQKNKQGTFDKLRSLDVFLDSLNAIIFNISKDKHVSITVKNNVAQNEQTEADWISSRLEERTFYRRYNANFKSVEKLERNIGYLDLRGFYGLDYGRDFADHAMAQLATSDAIIIDLRKNSGGRGDMVNYLLSYFFEDQIVTGRSRKRTGDNYVDREHTSTYRSKGKTIANTPVFILTSPMTFSAAEAFSYPMQVYGRATFIGETTKGGGNAGDLISVNDELQIFIPDVAALPHPVSKATFEGIGIIPDIQVKSEHALDTALVHAKKAAAEYKAALDKKAKDLLLELNDKVANYDGSDEQIIIDAYKACRDHDVIFEEWELNALGYQLLRNEQVKTALAIFKTNTILYPLSPNTFDSYAEALAQHGNKAESIVNYEKAVSIARENKDDRLEMFVSNLEKVSN